MNRVWKHFFKNLAWPVAIAVYVITLSISAAYADTLFEAGGFAVVFVFLIFPALAWLVRDMWQDAKQKVERENKEMIRTLKSADDWSDLYEK